MAEEAIGENMALLAADDRRFGETATGVTLGALRAAIDAGGSTSAPGVVLSSPGTG